MNTDKPDIRECMVGSYYDVPCVKAKASRLAWVKRAGIFGPGTLIPLIGPEHEDAEIIDFPDRHWHIDWRFVKPRIWNRLLPRDVLGMSWVFARVLRVDETEGEVRLMKRMCFRTMPMYPSEQYVPWLKKLEEAHADARMKCLVCPHRGLPLEGLPVVNGVVMCPGHGLRWDVESGQLVPRNR